MEQKEGKKFLGIKFGLRKRSLLSPKPKGDQGWCISLSGKKAGDHSLIQGAQRRGEGRIDGLGSAGKTLKGTHTINSDYGGWEDRRILRGRVRGGGRGNGRNHFGRDRSDQPKSGPPFRGRPNYGLDDKTVRG